MAVFFLTRPTSVTWSHYTYVPLLINLHKPRCPVINKLLLYYSFSGGTATLTPDQIAMGIGQFEMRGIIAENDAI